MIKKFISERVVPEKWDYIVLMEIILIGLYQVIRCLDYPGLYLDAVNPDYIAVQILFPQIKNENWTLPHSCFPLLGQLYHGTPTVWLQLLIVGLAGKATMFTLRLANMIYIMGICWIVYLIMKKIKVHNTIIIGTVTAIILSPQVFSFIRTQYYIKLPGILLLLCAIYCIMVVEKSGNKMGLIILSGFLNGMAFYSYFIYLFFVPATLLICIRKLKKSGFALSKIIFGWLLGFCSGSVLYVIGYFDMLISYSGVSWKSKVIVSVVGISLIAVCLILIVATIKVNEIKKHMYKLYALGGGIIIVSIVIILMNLSLISTVIRPYLDSLNVAGTKMNISERIVHMISLWKSVMTNYALEELMVNAKSSIMGYMYIICFCVLTLGVVPMIILGKGKLYNSIIFDEKINMLSSLFIVLISYAVGAIGFISRMGAQHFTPIFFIVLLIIGIEGDIIITFINKESLVKLIYIIGLFTILMGIINTNILHKNLQFTGGKNKFNAQINELSYEAFESRREGINDLYIFPDWGFMCGFNYLTMNQIPYLTTLDFEKIKLYTDNKYGIKICVWDYDDALEYEEMLKASGFYDLDINVKKGLDGEEAFYIVSFK